MIDRSKWYVCYKDDTTPLTWINGKAIQFPSEEVAKRFIYGLGWKGLVSYKAEIYWIFGIELPEDEEEDDYDYE